MNVTEYIKLKAVGRVTLSAEENSVVKVEYTKTGIDGTEKVSVEKLDIPGLHATRAQVTKALQDKKVEYAAIRADLAGIEQMIADFEAIQPELPDSL